MSCSGWGQNSPLHPYITLNIQLPYQYTAGYALCVQVHITRLVQHCQSRCQCMHNAHCHKPKRTLTSYSLYGAVTEKTEFMQENEGFQQALLTHACLELYICSWKAPSGWTHRSNYLAFDLLQVLPPFYMHHVGPVGLGCLFFFHLLFYWWWHIKAIEKSKNNAKINQKRTGMIKTLRKNAE